MLARDPNSACEGLNVDHKQIEQAVDDAAKAADDAAKTFGAVGAGAGGIATAYHLRWLRKKELDGAEDGSDSARTPPRQSRVLKPSGDEYFPEDWIKPRRSRKVRAGGARLAGMVRAYPAHARRVLRLIADAVLRRPW